MTRWRGFVLQLSAWLGFTFVYTIVRGLALDHRGAALAHGRAIEHAERATLGFSPEHVARAIVAAVPAGGAAASGVYWLSEFAVLAAALVWLYRNSPENFRLLRNSVLLVNVVALVPFALFPVAPPWAVAGHHLAGLAGDLGDPFAAFPSLHVADALLCGWYVRRACVPGARVSRLLWLAWAPVVAFATLATGNHYMIDGTVGGYLAIAVIAGAQLRLRSRDSLIAAEAAG